MAICNKCSAELVGSAKFCAACGAPVVRKASGEWGANSTNTPPSATRKSASNIVIAHPTNGDNAPESQVNPFASTASPLSRIPVEARSAAGPPSMGASGPALSGQPAPSENRAESASPPKSHSAGDGPKVSPLAVSGALSQRGAFQQVMGSMLDQTAAAPTPTAPATASPSKSKPGTQLISQPAGAPVSAQTPLQEASTPIKQRTVAMNFSSTPSAPGLSSGSISGTPIAPGGPQPSQPGAYSSPTAPQGGAVPHAGPHPPQAPGYAQQTPYAAQPAPGGWAWRPPSSPPAPQPNSFQYPFGYPPGTRVQVTWSNGQRYPATVTQVSGSQHFVVFPDGQRHWVDAQYLSRS